MNIKTITTAALITLSTLGVSQSVMADEIVTHTVNTQHLVISANPELTLAAIDSVQSRVERQVNQQLDMFIQAVDTSLTNNLDVITTAMVNN